MEVKIYPQPVMLYDDDCGFCLYWIRRWQKKSPRVIDYLPYNQEARNFPQVSEAACKEAVQLIMPDGSVTSGAHAIFKAMEIRGSSKIFHWLYDFTPLFGRFSEFLYQWVAHHRLLLSRFVSGSVKKCG